MADIEKDIKDTLATRPPPARPVMPVVAPTPMGAAELAVITGKRVPPAPEPHDKVKEHGDYEATAAYVQAHKDWMRGTPNWDKLSPGKKQALEMNAVKEARILHGDPNHPGHWEDISGYALLGLRSK